MRPGDQSYCYAGSTSVTELLLSLVGKDVLYTAFSGVIYCYAGSTAVTELLLSLVGEDVLYTAFSGVIYCYAGSTSVTELLLSLVGKDVLYTAFSGVISFYETTQNHKWQIRLLMMVKAHRHDFRCQELLHWQSTVRWSTVSLNQTFLVAPFF